MECHRELVEALGNNALPYRTVARRIGKFQQGRVSTSDEQRSGRQVSVWTDLAHAIIEQLMYYIKGYALHYGSIGPETTHIRLLCPKNWAVSLVVRASDFRPEGLGSMPPNTLRVHMEYMLIKSVGPKVLWAVVAGTTGAGGWRIFPFPPVPCLNCGGGDTGSGNIHSFPSRWTRQQQQHSSRIITPTIARLRANHYKGITVHSDETRCNIQQKKKKKKNCSEIQPLTPNHIFVFLAFPLKALKLGLIPLKKLLQEILSSRGSQTFCLIDSLPWFSIWG
ncbi:uncharacterized protein TNCV_1285751 [Trichonephila clavipes]|uniref:Transposase n=1 Tax=Trichonephila clavipes TaxID=2585209 RepID=A0A8X6SR67_TRICX|nr:uncharacterized protein TNCV_1285751 [Trichonephila clavipes]